MRKIILLLTISLAGTLHSFCQSDKSFFVEILGNGIGASLNFDSRLSKSDKGFGYRLGAGIFPGTLFNAPFVTIPLGVNYLAGHAPNYLEAGVGATVMPGVKVFWDDNYRASGVLFIPNLGYRYARKNKGFQGRLGISPWIGDGGVVFMGGLSVGYHF